MNVRWRMGRARLLALCVLLAVVVMVPAHAFGELVAEERLTFDSTPEWAPSVTGDRVAWRTTFTTYETGVFTWTAGGAVQQIWRGTDVGSGTNVQTSGDRTVWAVKAPVSMRYTIYSHTPAEGVRTVVSGLQYQPMLVALSGGAAYSGCVVGGNYEAYAWNATGGVTTKISSDTDRDWPLSAGKDRVVWICAGPGLYTSTVKSWTPSEGLRIIYSSPYVPKAVATDGTRVAWLCECADGYAVWTLTGAEAAHPVALTDAYATNLRLCGDRIAWIAGPTGNTADPQHVYTWDPVAGMQRVTTSPIGDGWMNMSGDSIVWDAPVTGTDELYAWTPEHGTERLTENAVNDWCPTIGGSRMAFIRTVGQYWDVFTGVLNYAPHAIDDAYAVTEDTTLAVGVTSGVVANDHDSEGDALTASLVTGPAHGTLVLAADGSFEYTPDADYFGPDSFTYLAHDGYFFSGAPGVVALNVQAVNDAPVLRVLSADVYAQYSDAVGPIELAGGDIDDTGLAPVACPMGCLSLTSFGTDPSSPCGCCISASFCGRALFPEGDHSVGFTLADDDGAYATASATVHVTPEDAAVRFTSGNPVSVEVASAGGAAPAFQLGIDVTEVETDPALLGRIELADVHVALEPVGPGARIELPVLHPDASGHVVAAFTAGVPVNAYEVVVTVDGGYYAGEGRDALAVCDPSLGFATGGGWFYWPGTTEKANFGFVSKYGAGSVPKGNLLVVRHLADGSTHKMESTSISGIYVGEATEDDASFGWALVRGRAAYTPPGTELALGGYSFELYAEDRGEPSAGDRFWLRMTDPGGVAVNALAMDVPRMSNAAPLQGGNVAVPHLNKK